MTVVLISGFTWNAKAQEFSSHQNGIVLIAGSFTEIKIYVCLN